MSEGGQGGGQRGAFVFVSLEKSSLGLIITSVLVTSVPEISQDPDEGCVQWMAGEIPKPQSEGVSQTNMK